MFLESYKMSEYFLTTLIKYLEIYAENYYSILNTDLKEIKKQYLIVEMSHGPLIDCKLCGTYITYYTISKRKRGYNSFYIGTSENIKWYKEGKGINITIDKYSDNYKRLYLKDC